MSHIYEALKKAELQRSRSQKPPSLMATDPPPPVETMEDAAPVDVHVPAPGQRSLSVGREGAPPLPDLEHCPALHVSPVLSGRLVAASGEESLGAEKFRFLAVRLRQLRQTRPLKKILVTSTIPQEGKSTVSANLACTLARRKQTRTVLLEGDLRRPTLAERFGIGTIPGLSEWFAGESARITLYRLENLGLWFLPAGTAPDNPLEMMQSAKMGSLMDQLEGWFDWIVIDSPPVLPLGDTSVWARMCDGILMVTRRGVTEKRQLKKGLAALDRSKLLGALVNGSVDAAHSDYYKRYGPSAPKFDVPPAK